MAGRSWLDQRPVRTIEPLRSAPDHWPGTIPAVRQLLDEGLELGRGVTFLVGENGSGKSTLVEAVAMAYGLDLEGGTIHTYRSTRASESPLHRWIRLVRGAGASRWGFFLRAETMHGLASLPGATIIEVGEWGMRPSTWEDLVLVQNWRAYLAEPQRYLRHVLD